MKTITALLLTILTLTLAACSGEGEPTSEIICYDIAKLESDSEQGSVFTLTKPSSDTEITLTTRQRINPDIVIEGERLMIVYVPATGRPYENSSITLRGIMPIINSKLIIETAKEFEGWDQNAVWLQSAWLMGDYLNIQCRLPYDERTRRFALVTEIGKEGTAWRDLYLAHILESEIPTFDRTYYASFDISELRNDPTVDGFTLHLNNSNLKIDEIRFALR